MLLFYAMFFVLGLTFGSFANVCIYRIPREISLWKPGSFCPECNTKIKWYFNLPLLGYIILKGKCSSCKLQISPQYPLIELLTGILFLLISFKFGFNYLIITHLTFTFVLVVITGIDFHHKIIPDILSYFLVLLGIASSFFNTELGISYSLRFINSISGAALGAGVLLLIAVIGKKIYKQEAMGGGDIKLMAGIGAVLGAEKIVSTILIASIIGSIVGLSLIYLNRIGKKDYIPFGPFLSIGAYISIFL